MFSEAEDGDPQDDDVCEAEQQHLGDAKWLGLSPRDGDELTLTEPAMA